jgi:hypothetical protein
MSCRDGHEKPVKGGATNERGCEVQRCDDVITHRSCRCRRHSYDGHLPSGKERERESSHRGPENATQAAEGAVRGAEVVAPPRQAVRLVHRCDTHHCS